MRFAMKRVKGNSFKLQEVIARAKSGKVFAGQIFYVTPKVQPDMQLLKHVIMSCGAQVRTSVRRQSRCSELSTSVPYDDAHSSHLGRQCQ